jgi:hypothetical protein
MINLKTFESFEHNNDKIWIFGTPSGECFQVSRKTLDILYDDRLLYYTIKIPSKTT